MITALTGEAIDRAQRLAGQARHSSPDRWPDDAVGDRDFPGRWPLGRASGPGGAAIPRRKTLKQLLTIC